MAEWNYNNLPAYEYDNVQRLLESRDGKALAKLHNKYKLSNNNYCCSENEVITHFKYLIKNKLDVAP